MNKARGEVSVKVGDVDLTLIPEFAAIEAIESQYDGLLAIMRRIELDGSMTACAHVLWAGASRGGEDKTPSLDDVRKMVTGNGADAIVAAQTFIVACLTGVFEPEPDSEDSSPDDGKSES